FSMDSEAIGTAAVVLGAGRARKEDAVNHAAGIRIEKKTGDYTKAGEVIATLYTDDESSLNDAQRRYLNAVQISSEKPKELPMILGKIE
ncbi:MAG: thymidine phosphorylase, partial [Oscillospiraceae bacterium]|nr:thymidine phosphorylase [Oscillospiraceae bacterium]